MDKLLTGISSSEEEMSFLGRTKQGKLLFLLCLEFGLFQRINCIIYLAAAACANCLHFMHVSYFIADRDALVDWYSRRLQGRMEIVTGEPLTDLSNGPAGEMFCVKPED